MSLLAASSNIFSQKGFILADIWGIAESNIWTAHFWILNASLAGQWLWQTRAAPQSAIATRWYRDSRWVTHCSTHFFQGSYACGPKLRKRLIKKQCADFICWVWCRSLFSRCTKNKIEPSHFSKIRPDDLPRIWTYVSTHVGSVIRLQNGNSKSVTSVSPFGYVRGTLFSIAAYRLSFVDHVLLYPWKLLSAEIRLLQIQICFDRTLHNMTDTVWVLQIFEYVPCIPFVFSFERFGIHQIVLRW